MTRSRFDAILFSSAFTTNLSNVFDAASNISGYALVLALGVPAPWWIWPLVVLAVGAWWARASAFRGLALGWCAMPLAWEHTVLLMWLPFCAALATALTRPVPERTARALGVFLAFLGLTIAGHLGQADDPRALRIVWCALTSCATVALLASIPRQLLAGDVRV